MSIAGIASRSKDGKLNIENICQRMGKALCHSHKQVLRTLVLNGLGLCEAPCSPMAEKRPGIVRDPSGRYSIAMAGEIFDWKKDMHRLGGMEHVGNKGALEAGYILKLYTKKGFSAFAGLNGSFCFAIHDALNKQLLVATDRMASWPVYYAVTQTGELAFSTEIYSLLQSGMLQAKLDIRALVELLGLQRVYGDKSLVEGISWLRPGTLLRWTPEKVSFDTYWKPIYKAVSGSVEDYAEEMARVVRRALDSRMRDGRTAGILLSGGLDSRMILAGSESTLKCFTFGDYENREYQIARRISAARGFPSIFLQRERGHYLRLLAPSVRIGSGMYAFNHAHPVGFVNKIQEVYGCDVLFHGFAPELLFRGTNIPYEVKQFRGIKYGRKVHFIGSEKELQSRILKRNYSLFSLKPWKVLRSVDENLVFECYRDTAKMLCTEAMSFANNPMDAYWWPDLHYHSRYPSYLFQMSLRPFVIERGVVFDNDMIDLHLHMPTEMRCGNRVWIRALKKLCPPLAGIPDANTGCPPTLPEPLQFLYSSRMKVFEGLPFAWRLASRKDYRNPHPEGLSPLSWPRFDWMIIHDAPFRRKIEEVIFNPKYIDPEIFDVSEVRRIFHNHVNGIQTNRNILFILLTFGEWYNLMRNSNC